MRPVRPRPTPPTLPRMGLVAEIAVGRHLVDQRQPAGGRKGSDDADVMQHGLVVVEAEHQGTDTLAALVQAEPGDHELGGAPRA